MNSLKDTTTFDVESLIKFFDPTIQEGKGAAAYSPTYRRQRGSGIASILGTIGRWLIPFAKKHILPNAVDMAKKVAGDVISHGNIRQSIKERGIEALKNTAKSVMGQSGSGARKRRRSTSSHKRSKKVKLQLGNGRRKKTRNRRKYRVAKRRTCYD